MYMRMKNLIIKSAEIDDPWKKIFSNELIFRLQVTDDL